MEITIENTLYSPALERVTGCFRQEMQAIILMLLEFLHQKRSCARERQNRQFIPL